MTNYEMLMTLSDIGVQRARKGNRKFWLFVAEFLRKKAGNLSVCEAERVSTFAKLIFG